MVRAGGCLVRLWLLALIVLPALPVRAQDDARRPQLEGDDEMDTPSLEMLEFLGGWQDGDGEGEDFLYWKEFFEEDVVIPRPKGGEDDEH